jgi:hypothetical protein
MDQALQQRVDQYRLAAYFARELIEELGEEEALPILKRAFDNLQVQNARDLVEKLGDNSFEAYAQHLRKLAEDSDSLQIYEVTDREVKTKITRCPAWEAFSHLGLPQLCHLYCESDHPYIKAFNPNMKLVRTKVIAYGDEYCDHIWALEE